MERELLFSITKKDLEITKFKGSGPGGQHRNKTETGCRIKHPASGAVVEDCSTKSYEQNKQKAFLKLPKHPKFKVWYSKVLWELRNKKTVEQQVEEMMAPKNLRVEVKKDGRWTKEES